jgi:hypothetical protein
MGGRTGGARRAVSLCRENRARGALAARAGAAGNLRAGFFSAGLLRGARRRAFTEGCLRLTAVLTRFTERFVGRLAVFFARRFAGRRAVFLAGLRVGFFTRRFADRRGAFFRGRLGFRRVVFLTGRPAAFLARRFTGRLAAFLARRFAGRRPLFAAAFLALRRTGFRTVRFTVRLAAFLSERLTPRFFDDFFRAADVLLRLTPPLRAFAILILLPSFS